ncbi:hypothetical protein IMSAGC014_00667 [Bacteroidaceae bacterium]|uniref:DMP19 family protein n=1 Tax=Prevotella sp. MGM2 TaxID=2033406 RepID=UPI000CE9F929|nr:DMP19 family protein [Prevotella sp. MGM2]GAY29816.1 DUF4375 domain-containing protein [Prevotella sp. MGM2]GFI34178.1 hypothetical protein IMSAGC014_00667 [Bacteroidaceae bacterium]
MNKIEIKDKELREAAEHGVEAFATLVKDHIARAAGGILSGESLSLLNAEQITLWGYFIMRDELMDGGFIQLIYNGYGPFFFDNPFAKAMRLWGLRELSKLIYKAKVFYEEDKKILTCECTDEDFMSLFEQFPHYDDLDDEFVENEEEYTTAIAHYVDENLEKFNIKIID